jgi:hypothetical protein
MSKPPARDWPNPTQAAVRLPGGEESDKVTELLTRLLGERVVPQDVAHLVGALDNATVDLGADPDRQVIQARIEHEDFEHWERQLRKDKAGKVYIWNEKMRIRTHKQGGGIGIGRLRAQVENPFHGGISYIACHAARVNAENPDPDRAFRGYLLWPKCGFDQTLEEVEKGTENADDVRQGTPAAFPEVATAIRERFGDVKSIQDLFEEEGGAEWWQVNGVELYRAVFDLMAGSRSLEIFDAYLLHPKRGGMPLCLKSPI